MKSRDIFTTIILSMVGIGLGQIYTQQKRKGFIIMGVQITLLILAGVTMFISGILSQIMYMAVFGVAIWATYDAVLEAKYINEEISDY